MWVWNMSRVSFTRETEINKCRTGVPKGNIYFPNEFFVVLYVSLILTYVCFIVRYPLFQNQPIAQTLPFVDIN